MAGELFLDTSFAIALASKKDDLHPRAVSLAQEIKSQQNSLITTQAVLLEIGNSLSRFSTRSFCIAFLEELESDSITDVLYDKAFDLFRSMRDKEWGLVDCISFIVMRERGSNHALTADEHFVQAGFRALLRDQIG